MAIQGVNIGGWLIPEKWLTPSLFSGTNANDLYALLKSKEGRARYDKHLAQFIQEADFKWLSKRNIKWIRLPVGYWALSDEPPYPSTKQYLDWAMKMAEKYGMEVLLDLHAVKGSQNGTVHSGRIGVSNWQSNHVYQDETIDALITIAKRYRDSPVLWGIELVNEPRLGGHYFTLLKFYRRAYKELVNVMRPGTYTVFHDAFSPLLFSGAIKARSDFPVAMDTHLYLVPGMSSASLSQYLWWQRLLFGSLLWIVKRAQPVIVGEWSSVLPQKLFDSTELHKHTELLAENISSQQKLYDRALAHSYWNYKAEGEGMWNFRSLVERGNLKV